jgi:hypothetical protein
VVGGTVVGDSGVGVAAGPQAESSIAARIIRDRTSEITRLCFMHSSPLYMILSTSQGLPARA